MISKPGSMADQATSGSRLRPCDPLSVPAARDQRAVRSPALAVSALRPRPAAGPTATRQAGARCGAEERRRAGLRGVRPRHQPPASSRVHGHAGVARRSFRSGRHRGGRDRRGARQAGAAAHVWPRGLPQERGAANLSRGFEPSCTRSTPPATFALAVTGSRTRCTSMNHCCATSPSTTDHRRPSAPKSASAAYPRSALL